MTLEYIGILELYSCYICSCGIYTGALLLLEKILVLYWEHILVHYIIKSSKVFKDQKVVVAKMKLQKLEVIP